MYSKMKVTRIGDQVTLIARNGGKPLAWLLVLEAVLLGVLLGLLAGAMPTLEAMALPVAASGGLMLWTFLQIESDYRITMNLASGAGRVVRITPMIGEQLIADFPLSAVESLTLEQAKRQSGHRQGFIEYVLAVELRGGGRHVLSARGPMLAYMDNVARFARAAGVATRVVRQTAA